MPTQRKKAKVCALSPREATDSRLARLSVPSTRHYSNRQILCSMSEKLKRILLGLLGRLEASEEQNRTRRATSRAKNDGGRAPDAFRDATATHIADTLDAAGLSAFAPSGRKATRATGVAIDAARLLARASNGNDAARATGSRPQCCRITRPHPGWEAGRRERLESRNRYRRTACPRPERGQGGAGDRKSRSMLLDRSPPSRVGGQGNCKSLSMLLNCLSSPAGRGGQCSSSAGRPSYAP